MKPEYLSFLVTMAHCPLLYIHGNHDGIYERKEPEGCICIENQIYEYKGIRILGLGGSCVHLNYGRKPRVTKYKNTVIINGYESYIFTYEE